MNIVDIGLSRARTTIAILILLLLAGSIAYRDIPKESSPDVSVPIIYISMSLEGISPSDSERLLVKPMEKELKNVEGVKIMTSSAYQGGANVVLEFDAGFESGEALIDVRKGVDDAKKNLPENADEPTVNEVNISLFPILLITLKGNVGGRHLLRRAEILQDKIEGLSPVLSANIQGEREEVVELLIDQSALESYSLTPNEVRQAVQRSNLLVPAGSLQGSGGSFDIKLPGLIEVEDEIANIPIRSEGGSILSLGDVSQLRRSFKDVKTYARLDGDNSLTLQIVKRTGENIIEAVEQTRAIVEEESASWNDGVEIIYTQDESENVRRQLNDLRNNILSAILLVMIVVVATLGLQAGLLVGVTIPGAFLTAVLVLYISGFTINMVVLFGLIMSVGLLVDGAVVVVEYAERKKDEGYSPAQAYALASKRMALPIMSSTATTLAAFMPLMFWPGIIGEFMRYLPLTLIFVLSASLVMALFFMPVLGAHFKSVIAICIAAISGIVPFQILGVFLPTALAFLIAIFTANYGYRKFVPPVLRFIDSLAHNHKASKEDADSLLIDIKKSSQFAQKYVSFLETMLDNPTRVLRYAALALLASWVSYIILGRGVEFFPNIDPESAAVLVHGRGNLSVQERDELVGQVEQAIIEYGVRTKSIESVFTTSGFVNVEGEDSQDIIGQVLVSFPPYAQRPFSSARSLRDLRDLDKSFGGISVELRESSQGPPSGKPIALEVTSSDLSLLNDAAKKIRKLVESEDGVIDVEDTLAIPGIEWQLNINRGAATRFGADISTIGAFVRLVTNGFKVGSYRPDDSEDEIDIFLRLPQEQRTLETLSKLQITTPAGRAPIGNFVTRTPAEPSGILRRVDQRRVIKIKADVRAGILVNDKLQSIRKALPELDLPPQISVLFKGEDQDQREASAFLGRAFLIALFAMALILLTQFNNFYQCFLILSAVIMSTIGVMLGLLITRQPFGIIMSGIGVISLAGIVVNNNIVLIDTFNRIYKATGNLRLSILQTGAQRLRPVLLTTSTTVLGLLPMVLTANIDFFKRSVEIGAPSAQWWQQLAIAIVFGMCFATILTLIVTPSALMLMESKGLLGQATRFSLASIGGAGKKSIRGIGKLGGKVLKPLRR